MEFMGKIVGLVKTQSSGEDIKEAVVRVLDLIGFKSKSNIASVAIKPNLCYYWNASTGYTTDPRLISGIIDWVRDTYGVDTDIKIAEADATAMRTKHAFVMLGYEKLAASKNVALFNLSDDNTTERKIKIGNREIEFKIPLSLLNTDLFISVPKLKIMRDVKITCAFKNTFGCIASRRKIVYHPFLEKAIVGINKILRPNLTIVDGLVALGSHPVKLDLIMAGTDPFSVDWVASQIMGYNPSRIKFMKIAMAEKVGNPEGITIRGENIEEFKRIFPKESVLSLNRYWNFLIRLFKLYVKVTKDVIHPSMDGV
jgi:uncharacterized protein (DUF362 family)